MILQKVGQLVAEMFHHEQFKCLEQNQKALKKCSLVDVSGNIVLQKIWDNMAAGKVSLKQAKIVKPRQQSKSVKSLSESENDNTKDDEEPPKKKRLLRSESVTIRNQSPSTSQKELMDK